MPRSRSLGAAWGSALVLSALLAGPGRTQVVAAGAGTQEAHARARASAIRAGLQWLAAHQDGDGRFSAAEFMKHDPADAPGGPSTGAGQPVHDIGATGLALLAFHADGSTLRQGAYREHVKRAVNWLRNQQGDDGLFGESSGHAYMYNHGIATLAMIEAYGLAKYRTLEPTCKKAIRYILEARNPYKVWRYYPRDGQNDSSVTGWMVCALRAARDFGLEIDPQALKFAAAWYEEVTDPNTGQVGYMRRGDPSSRLAKTIEDFPPHETEALTALGLFARFLLGQSPQQQPVMMTAADSMLRKPPRYDPEAGSVDFYYWYFGSLAMSQIGGKHQETWDAALTAALLPAQRQDGAAEGSWDPHGAWGEVGGRVYTTALAVLALQPGQRRSRMVRAPEQAPEQAPQQAAPALTTVIERGLAWLAAHQDANGRFSVAEFMAHDPKDAPGGPCTGPGVPTHDIGATGLAVLAFLGQGSTLRRGPYRDNVKRAVDWLVQQQGEDGLIGAESGHGFQYNHGIATFALIEALTASHYYDLKEPIEKAVTYVEKARNPYKVWRYFPQDGQNDSSVTGWMVRALTAARGAGFEVAEPALKFSAAWFEEVTDPATGQVGYTRRGERSSRQAGTEQQFPADRTEALTAVGMLCRLALGQSPETHPVLMTAADTMLRKPPKYDTEGGSIDFYYWYYGAEAMRRIGGEHWRRWCGEVEEALLRTQKTGGCAQGSWDPLGAWGEVGGRVYTTALALLALQSCQRSVPRRR